ncbi:MAG TPA: L,D-transpeptidase family protein [Gemmatimonadaceae bacterium]|nr:L,D-transpeptidase family protein [Gemmatimonadaceae bacterium]
MRRGQSEAGTGKKRPPLAGTCAAARLGVLALAVSLTVPFATSAQDPAASLAGALEAAIAEAQMPSDRSEMVATRAALRRLYDSAGMRPIWTAEGRPTAQTLRLAARLETLADRGLRASDVGADSLARWTMRLDQWPAAGSAEITRFDVAASVAAMRAIGDLHAGRIDPRSLGFQLPRVHAKADLAALALRVARAPDVHAALAALEPPYPGYRALLPVLARYRALASDPSLSVPRPHHSVLRPGDRYDDAPALRSLLVALGDLPPDRRVGGDTVLEPPDPAAYDDALVEAVVAFQRRHGLAPDGVIGPATTAALRIPMSERVLQIELTLERWRWLPDAPPAAYVLVNLPAFRLDLFEPAVAGARPVLWMDVIVGEARHHHETPVFLGTMREVVFRPYWDVPLSIARKELIPMLRRDPGYLSREGMEIVRGGDFDAVIHPLTDANLDRVHAGSLRLRQRPGTRNALGPIKFVFPNAYNVYLHGTPATQLFERTRRDFSHGCIRVADPKSLAEQVLRSQPEWDRPAIDLATRDGEPTRRIRVTRAIDVYVFYATAFAAEDGRAYFFPDIYGHDAKLAAVFGGER